MDVYIDESGDEGINSGRRWLTVAGALVDEDRKDHIEKTLATLSGQLAGGRPLHFHKLSHRNKRAALNRLIYGPHWYGVMAMFDTTKPLPARTTPTLVYYDALAEVVVRGLRAAGDWTGPHEQPRFIIDNREGRFDLEAFKTHLQRRDWAGDPYTDASLLNLDKIVMAEPDDEPCLSLADGLANSAFEAFQPNDWSGQELSYLNMCLEKLWRPKIPVDSGIMPYRWGSYMGNGLILLPTPEIWNFLKEYPWLREWAEK